MTERLVHHDVAIVGGGPAGVAAAIRLAGLGRRVTLLERERFPRFHIGESLLPASHGIFRKLGLEERLRAESFVLKRGASFTTEDGGLSGYIDFSSSPEVEVPVAYQVLRSRFDEILLEGAGEAGVEVRQGCRVRDVMLEPEGVTVTVPPPLDPPEVTVPPPLDPPEGTVPPPLDPPEVTVPPPLDPPEGTVSRDGRAGRLTAEILIDASGQAGFLAKRLGLRRVDDELRNVAIYAHFEGIPRPPGERSGDIRIISRRDMSWIWLIPLSTTLTSVGVVIPRHAHAARSDGTPDQVLGRYLESTPHVAAQMDDARQVSTARYEADFCYAPRAYAGSRWLIAGDAGGFIDPVFSSGVQLAMISGIEAAEAAHRALGAGDFSVRAFAAYQRTQRRRYKFLFRLVRGFYQRSFRDLFVSPANHFGILDAMVAVLAGNWPVPFSSRWKIEMFYALAFAQRFLPLAPRSHSL